MRKSLLLLLACAGLVGAQDSLQPAPTIVFEGNTTISKEELQDVTNKCFATSRSRESYVDYCLWKVKSYLGAKGYLQAKLGTSTEQKSNQGPKLTVPIDQGPLFRLGKIEIEGSTVFTPTHLRAMLRLQADDIADSEKLSEWANQTLKKLYSEHGYIQYTAELEPKYRSEAGGQEGILDLLVNIDEGKKFKVKSINFEGNGDVAADWLLREMLLRKGEAFNQQLFEDSVRKLNQTALFETIDHDKDVDYRTDQKSPLLDITIHLKRKKP